MSRTAPRVSIGLPVFNGGEFLAASIESILAQSFTDFELILSDNGSTDRTEEICRTYAERDGRIRYHRAPENMGAAWNYNRSFELATGTYFKWASHDDLHLPGFVEKCVAVLDADPGVALAFTKTDFIDEHDRVVRHYVYGLRMDSDDVRVRFWDMRGEPSTMQQFATYGDVVAEVGQELQDLADDARTAGIEQVLIDPGIGFAKTWEHNLELLARADEFQRIAPVVIGASRKAFIGHLTGRAAGPDRAIGSLAAVAAAFRAGAAMVRVHDVRETVEFLKVLAAIEERRR